VGSQQHHIFHHVLAKYQCLDESFQDIGTISRQHGSMNNNKKKEKKKKKN